MLPGASEARMAGEDFISSTLIMPTHDWRCPPMGDKVLEMVISAQECS